LGYPIRAEELAVAVTFSGEFISPRTPDEVYDFLCDANQLGPLLPDFESMSVEDATHFTVKVRMAVGNIRGTAEIKMELAEAVRPIRAQYQGRGNAVGSQIAISTGFDLSPLAEGTRIAWQGETSVLGKLALLAGGMLEPVSRKNIQKLMDGLRSSLAYPPAQGVAQPAPSEAVQSAPAEQPVQAPQQELPSEAEQGTSAAPAQSTAEELLPPE
jgi:carbon monoxide dehydrogenase subunit G